MATTDARKTTPADITAAAVASFERCADPRLRELMQALVRHLHGFAAEVWLTEEEWREMIAVLTATGDITDERRQEFILWSDALGLSMLVDALAHELPAGATESTVLGPFYVPGSPLRAVRREHGGRGGRRGAGLGPRPGARRRRARRSPAPSSTCGRTAPTCSTRSSARRPRRTTCAAAT